MHRQVNLQESLHFDTILIFCLFISYDSHGSVIIFVNIFNQLEFVMDNQCVFVR